MTNAAFEIKTQAIGTRSKSRRDRIWTITGDDIARVREFGGHNVVAADESIKAEARTRYAGWTDEQIARLVAEDRHLAVVGWRCGIGIEYVTAVAA